MIDDRPGIVASLARVFAQHGINLDAVLQEPGWPKTELPFVMTLEPCSSAAVAAALADAARFDFHVRPPLWLPMFVDPSRRDDGFSAGAGVNAVGPRLGARRRRRATMGGTGATRAGAEAAADQSEGEERP